MDAASLRATAQRYSNEGFLVEAMDVLTNAIVVGSGDILTNLYADRAYISCRIGAIEDAMNDCKLCIQSDPENYLGYFTTANIYYKINNFQSAAEYYRLAGSFAPDNQEIKDKLSELESATTTQSENVTPKKRASLESAFPDIHKNWEAQKLQALHCLEQTQQMVTSFTDQQPIHGWESVHAIRELWQNFRDGLNITFGDNPQKFLIQYQRSEFNDHIIHAKCGQTVVGYVDLTFKDKLVISQAYCILGLQCLALASSKRKKGGMQIGGHGEGFKVGINLLLRKGYTVKYSMPFYEWKFSLKQIFRQTSDEICRSMVVDITSDSRMTRDDLLIEIEGHDASSLFDMNMDIQLTNGLRLECECRDGSILSSLHKCHYGRVYCRGLFVAYEDDFKHLQLVLNLNSQVARDRHLLPHGTWDLINSILTEATNRKCHIPIMDHLLFICKSLNEKVLSKSLPYIKPSLRRYVAQQNNITEDKVVFVEVDDSPSENTLRELGKFVVSAGALADAIDLEKMKMDFVSKLPKILYKDLTNEEKAISDAFGRFLEALSINFSMFKYPVHVKEIPLSMADKYPIFYLGEAIIDRSSLTRGDIRMASFKLVQKYRFDNGRILYQIFDTFSLDPINFQPVKYEEMKSESLTNRKSPDTQPSESSNKQSSTETKLNVHKSTDTDVNIHNFDDSSQKETRINIDTLGNSTQRNPLLPNDKVKKCDYNGNYTASNVEEDDEEPNHVKRCGIFLGSLSPLVFYSMEDVILYMDDDLAYLSTDDKVMARIVQSLASIHAITKNLAARVSNALRIDEANMPVMLVATTPKLLGFNKMGGIHINILPLLGLSENHMKASIYFTLLHELTHRSHKNHDTFFADELAKLVCCTSHCLDCRAEIR